MVNRFLTKTTITYRYLVKNKIFWFLPLRYKFAVLLSWREIERIPHAQLSNLTY